MILLTFQKGPNGTHQLVAALNGRSMSPNQEMAETTANLVTLEKPFEDNDVSADSSSQHQLCKNTNLYSTRNPASRASKRALIVAIKPSSYVHRL